MELSEGGETTNLCRNILITVCSDLAQNHQIDWMLARDTFEPVKQLECQDPLFVLCQITALAVVAASLEYYKLLPTTPLRNLDLVSSVK